MKDITKDIIELIRLTSTDLPSDVEGALREAFQREETGSAARGALETILQNIEISRRDSTPICQDTGTPLFFVSVPAENSFAGIRHQITEAVIEATKRSYLRPNAVDALAEINTGNNVGGRDFPVIHFQEAAGDVLTMNLILKGGGSENVGTQYALPNAQLHAARDLDGVRKVVLHAVQKAQGQGCAPGILGVAIGGDRSSSYEASKAVLLRKLSDCHQYPALADLERRIMAQANQLGIGPMGFGGCTTVLGVKIAALTRHPASYFVTVSYMCWACRRRRMIVSDDKIVYE
ncbi:MAG: fumarate hydratase subunit alpha [Syntrophus sp. SKADARSKE-3]|nr:fumarate hydratase subunit alpha [Syntrophus sp. SKADARSKE-3]